MLRLRIELICDALVYVDVFQGTGADDEWVTAGRVCFTRPWFDASPLAGLEEGGTLDVPLQVAGANLA